MTAQAGERARLRLIVSGRVQGVFFRVSAAEEARKLGLAGWVRNLPSGGVEIVAEGMRRNLEILWAWAQSGPPLAQVMEVREEWSEFRNEFQSFGVR